MESLLSSQTLRRNGSLKTGTEPVRPGTPGTALRYCVHVRYSTRARREQGRIRRGLPPLCRMSGPRTALTVGVLALAVLIGVGIGELAGSHRGGSGSLAKLSREEIELKLAGSPAPLAGLHEQAGQLLAGGSAALHRRLAELKGYPVVINKWASWCEPCRAEFPIFEHASANLGRRVAFIGLDSGDSGRANALAFLGSHRVSYPSYYDPGGALGEQLTFSSFTPVTVFIARDGSTYRHQGPYRTLEKLERDVERYGVDA